PPRRRAGSARTAPRPGRRPRRAATADCRSAGRRRATPRSGSPPFPSAYCASLLPSNLVTLENLRCPDLDAFRAPVRVRAVGPVGLVDDQLADHLVVAVHLEHVALAQFFHHVGVEPDVDAELAHALEDADLAVGR